MSPVSAVNPVKSGEVVAKKKTVEVVQWVETPNRGSNHQHEGAVTAMTVTARHLDFRGIAVVEGRTAERKEENGLCFNPGSG